MITRREQAICDHVARNTQSPVPLWRMTEEEQFRQQTGPGTEGLPGFVVVDPGPNPWYFDDESGEWTQLKDIED